MNTNLEDLVAMFALIAIASPSPIALLRFLNTMRTRSVEFVRPTFRFGIGVHVINSLFSPGIPAYFHHIDVETGGGSMASMLSFPVIILAWIISTKADGKIYELVPKKP